MPWFFVLHWYICLLHRHCWFVSIDLIALLSIFTLIFSMIDLITSHAYTCHYISFDSTYWSIGLYIILIVFEHDVCITICIDYHILAYLVCIHDDISDLCLIACRMTVLLCVIACRLSMWDAHLSPYLSPSSLGHFLHYGSHFCKCETLCVLVLWPR